MMLVHGGPTWLDLDRWHPEVHAYVDAGFAVGLVNYRGSIGYGREWRDALIGDIGGPELEDVNAGLRDLVERGIADPTRAVIAGYSWGGYVTLLELGKHPELWICGVAGVPVGDYETAYEEVSPLLQAYDRALAMDSRGRIFVGDRANNRIKIIDQEGKLLEVWEQFSRPSGIYIDKQDNIYVADSGNHLIRKVTQAGVVTTMAGVAGMRCT